VVCAVSTDTFMHLISGKEWGEMYVIYKDMNQNIFTLFWKRK